MCVPAISVGSELLVLHDQQIHIRVGCVAAAGTRAEEVDTARINLLNYGLYHFLNQLFRQPYQISALSIISPEP